VQIRLTAFVIAAVLAVSSHAKAAPRTIDDCEKIQAADAYNQCLALFGPVARGHASLADGAGFTGAKAAKPGSQMADAAEPARQRRHAGRHHSSARHHHWARRGHGHKIAAHRHGRGTAMAFRVVSGHTRLR
jgi:hypothetical protein